MEERERSTSGDGAKGVREARHGWKQGFRLMARKEIRETKRKGERVNACEGRDERRACKGERRGR